MAFCPIQEMLGTAATVMMARDGGDQPIRAGFADTELICAIVIEGRPVG
jgi:hypothetical protein